MTVSGTNVQPAERVAQSLVALVNSSAPAGNLFSGQFCGGVLISDHEVLTVAHCMRGIGLEDVDAVVGANNLCSGRPVTGERFHVAKMTAAPNGSDSDVVILTLAGTAHTPPALLGASPEAFPRGVTAQGWGSAGLSAPSPCTARPVALTAAAAPDCANARSHAGSQRPTRDVWCGTGTVASTCVGDSGGPVYGRTNPDIVLALTSWGYGSCSPGSPTFFSRLYGGTSRPWRPLTLATPILSTLTKDSR